MKVRNSLRYIRRRRAAAICVILGVAISVTAMWIGDINNRIDDTILSVNIAYEVGE